MHGVGSQCREGECVMAWIMNFGDQSNAWFGLAGAIKRFGSKLQYLKMLNIYGLLLLHFWNLNPIFTDKWKYQLQKWIKILWIRDAIHSFMM